MTDRIRYMTVLLEKNVRDDDVQYIIDAIKMIRFVRDVKRGEVNDMNQIIASDDFLSSAGELIVRLTRALSSGFGSAADKEFLEAVRNAASIHKKKRGY